MKLFKLYFLLQSSLLASNFQDTLHSFNPIGDFTSNVISTAKQFIGIPYKFGANSAIAMDCSAFVQQVFNKFGVNLPRTAYEQSQLGEKVSISNLHIGDLLFFETYKKGPSHVGIYAGNNTMIHSPSYGHKVQINSLDTEYYKKHFLFATRIKTPSIALADATEVFPSF